MKKILLTVVLAGMSGGLFAQLSKGTIAFTGTIGLGGNKQNNDQTSAGVTTSNLDQKTSQFLILPAVGYFVTDKLEAGIALLISKSTTTNNYAAPNPTQKIVNENPLNGFGLYGNYYLMNAEKFNLYAGLQFGIAAGTGKVTTTPFSGNTTIVETKNNASTVGLNMGFLYFIKSNLAFNGSIGLLSFNTIKTETTNNNITTNTKNGSWVFGVNGLVVNIGVKVFLNKMAK